MTQKVALAVGPSGSPRYPVDVLATTVATGTPLTATTLAASSVIAAAAGQGVLNVPALAAGASLTLNCVLGIPVPVFTLATGATMTVLPSVFLSSLPVGLIIGTPTLSLQGPGVIYGTWQVTGKQQIAALNILATFSIYAPSGSAVQSLNVQANVAFLGQSS